MLDLPLILLLGLPLLQGAGEWIAMKRLGTLARSHRVEWTFFAANVPYWLLIVCGILEYRYTPASPGFVELLAGAALATLGVVLRIRCHFELRGGFSPFVTITPNQQLITGGVYRHLRHPMYLGSLLLLIGLPMVVGATYAWAFSLLACVGLLCRIHAEERLLLEHLPGYDDYSRATWRLVPLVW